MDAYVVNYWRKFNDDAPAPPVVTPPAGHTASAECQEEAAAATAASQGDVEARATPPPADGSLQAQDGGDSPH